MPAQVTAAVRTAESTFGGIDVLVNNAGYGLLAAVEESEEAEVRAMFEANFFGLARMIHAVLPSMRQRRKGYIVNISSVGGLVGLAGVGYYNATKFAVEGLSEALAKEVEPLGIKVLIVEPGPFRTDWAGRSIDSPGRKLKTMPIRSGPDAARSRATAASNPVILHVRRRLYSRPWSLQTLRFTWCLGASALAPCGRSSNGSKMI